MLAAPAGPFGDPSGSWASAGHGGGIHLDPSFLQRPWGAPGYVAQAGNPRRRQVLLEDPHTTFLSPSVCDMICKLRCEVRENCDIAGIITKNYEVCRKTVTGCVSEINSEIANALKGLRSPATPLGLMRLMSCLQLGDQFRNDLTVQHSAVLDRTR